ncbi:MAG TPA: MFS transporter [Candidatus Limnocylindrales bacterium]|nr:MFS transporter [Candidatus Limnocylindrales bacterium]
MTESVARLGIDDVPAAEGTRPSATLPISALIRISAFWLGLTSIDAVVNATIQARLEFGDIVTPGTEGSALAFIAAVTFLFSVAVQPTVGSISDYTTTRWGRRKPYIVFGAVLDVVFLVGIATANSLLAIAAFVTLLQFSTNTARGAFQGYVPDLVPDRQVGLASAMVGLMQVFGNVLGFGLAAIATAEGNVGLAVGAIAVIEIITMLSVVLRVPKGPPAKPREGRSWLQIAAETWGTDILKERSYVWLLISRLFILMGGASLVNFLLFYLPRSLGIAESDIDSAVLQLLAAATLAAVLSIIPASRLSDRIGRKPVIWGCTAIGMVGLILVALAPNLTLATIGAALLGSSQGTFLSVDWALMTDIIPKAASGRYMGLSNVVTASSTTFAVAIGGLTMDAVGRSVGTGAGPRTVMLLGLIWFTLGAFALRPVVEPHRGRGAQAGATPAVPGTP